MQMKSLARRLALAVLIVAPVAHADNDPQHHDDTQKSAKLADQDVQLLAHFHHVNQLEVELGLLALRNSHSRAVKNYAQQIIDDHKQSDRKLTAFAKKHNVKIPTPTATSESEQKDMKDATDAKDRLKGKKGADFDREYLQMMSSDHDKEVADIDSEAAKAETPELATLIRDMKPVLQRHADNARDLVKSNDQDPNAPMPQH